MKNLRVSTKRFSLFLQQVTALSLPFALQLIAGCSMNQQNFIENCKVPLKSSDCFSDTDVENTDEQSDNFVHQLLEEGRFKALRLFLQDLYKNNKKDLYRLLNAKNKDGLTPFQLCIKKIDLGNHQYYKALGELVKHINYIDCKNGTTLYLHYIFDLIKEIKVETKQIQKILLKLLDEYKDINITSKNKEGYSFFHRVIWLSKMSHSSSHANGCIAIMSKLLDKLDKPEYFIDPLILLIHYSIPCDKLKIPGYKASPYGTMQYGANLALIKKLIKKVQDLYINDGMSKINANEKLFRMLVPSDSKKFSLFAYIARNFPHDSFKKFVKDLNSLLELSSQQFEDMMLNIVNANIEQIPKGTKKECKKIIEKIKKNNENICSVQKKTSIGRWL